MTDQARSDAARKGHATSKDPQEPTREIEAYKLRTQGLTYQAIADHQHVSLERARNRVTRGRKRTTEQICPTCGGTGIIAKPLDEA